ncbi:MAG: DUF1009 domain-containing protein [Alphaproteobacteria bacterium]|nr:DUF1009 domain-containing protein [Alphaproteobacteria bacterium]
MARWRKLGIIAGAGDLPCRLAAACAANCDPFFVVRLKGLADAALGAFPNEECGLAELGLIIRTLKNEACDAVVFAGVVRRPNFASLRPDWRGAALLPKLATAARRGDGAILAALVETFEGEGFIVVGAEEIASALAARAGALGRIVPGEADFADMKKAAMLVAALGPFDVGQGAVVAAGHVLAIEAAEGTDAMLDRCAALRESEDARLGVLLKRPKPGQELRIDLPTIGPETVRRAARAGLAGIAVEAGVSLVIDPEATASEADAHDLFVYGFVDAEVRGP